MDYRKKFLSAASRQGWLEASGILCALSGGGDSVAMLWLLKKFFKGRLVAAHLDHCTRDGLSHKDALFVRELCCGWEIECAVKVIDVHHCRNRGESFEMAGRRMRYEYFYDTAERFKLPYIAVGHNANDVVETQLMNLARGSGLAGLRGIPEVRGNIVRPVIGFSREELRKILTEDGIPWRDDFTNDESNYRRNKVRNILIPWIKENLNAGFEGVMLGLATQINAEVEAKERAAREEIKKVSFLLPPALAVWRTGGLKELPKLTLADMLRLQGADLSLPALSRARTNELTALVLRGGCWRFQWARDIEICHSERGIGWLHRADIKAGKNFSKNTCKNMLPWWAR